MKTQIPGLSFRAGLCLAALSLVHVVRAADDNFRVSVVVDTTDEGDRQPKPDPGKPIYYFPWTAGFVGLGSPLNGLKPPPPSPEVQHLIAKALAERGFRVANKGHPPSIVLVLWWGYINPNIEQRATNYAGGSAFNGPADSIYMPGIGISNGVSHGGDSAVNAPKGVTAAQWMGGGMYIPKGLIWDFIDEHESFVMLAGERFQEALGKHKSDTDELHQAATHPRYFLMVSALDFKSAIEKKPVLLWCARVSTELQGRDISDVLPMLIANGAHYFGEDSGTVRFLTVPAGTVLVGQPHLKGDGK
jgi:hypothetical protein